MSSILIVMEQEKLIRFISGLSDAPEQKEVLDWIHESEENRRTFAGLKNINVAVDILVQDYGKTGISVKPAEKRSFIKSSLIWSARIAAVLVVAVSLFFIGKESEKTKWMKTSAEQFTEVKVPYGESVTLVLPDSSVVKLNSGSILRFSKLFGHSNRSLSLDGEGYFEVRKGEKQFIVSTSDMDINVLGTTFNISAYSEDRFITTSLYEGKLRVFNSSLGEYVFLNPSDSYIYDKIERKANMRSFNKSHKWTDNLFVANSDDIEVFVKKIERKYDVKIIVAPELIGKCRYSGVFKGESLKEILDNMTVASPIKYQIRKDKTVIIMRADKK